MAGKHYDAEELLRIANMRKRGHSIRAIAMALERTSSGIQGILRAHGWIDPKRSSVMSSVRIFSPDQREVFRNFVSSRASGQTSTDIRDAWNAEATRKQWPTVNNERVLYYLRECGLAKTKGEYMQFESYRKRQSTAQRSRRSKEHSARLRALRARREEVYGREPGLSRRKCSLCSETWPLTDEFFRHSGQGSRYFLKTCKICFRNVGGTAEERRKQRLEAYDRHVMVKQISLAKVERDAFLQQHRNFPVRTCSRCQETWELLPRRFPQYKLPSGCELYRQTCRFCLRADARGKERAKVHLDRTQVATAGSANKKQRVQRQSNVASFPWSLLKESPATPRPDAP
jgi:hypothetical protein